MFLLLQSCSSDDSVTSFSVRQIQERLAQIRCEAAAKCCPSKTSQDIAPCMEKLRVRDEDLVSFYEKGIEQGHYKILSENIKSCLEGHTNYYATCGTPSVPHPDIGCSYVIVGTRPQGASCDTTNNLECEAGTVCAFGPNGTGTCISLKTKIGESCSDDAPCALGHGLTCLPETKTCGTLRGNGESCRRFEDCKSLRCNTFIGKCVPETIEEDVCKI